MFASANLDKSLALTPSTQFAGWAIDSANVRRKCRPILVLFRLATISAISFESIGKLVAEGSGLPNTTPPHFVVTMKCFALVVEGERYFLDHFCACSGLDGF
jgi:hypothetical protein